METVKLKRLLKEWLEIKKCPVPNINISPLNEENLNEWHGNIQGTESSEWQGIVVHFVVTFPVGYPNFPPRVQLCSFVPHLNVQNRGGTWEICLDMLENPPANTLTIPYKYWSSAFSIRSILVQLSSFLLTNDHITQNSIGNIDRTRVETQQFSCICGHSHSNPVPLLPTEDEIYNSPISYPCIEVIGEGSKLLEARLSHRKEILDKQKIVSKSNWNEIIRKSSESNSNKWFEDTSNIESKDGEILNSKTSTDFSYASILSLSSELASNSINKVSESFQSINNITQDNINMNNNSNNNNNDNDNETITITDSENNTDDNTIINYETYSCSSCLHKLEESFFTKSQLRKGIDRKCIKCVSNIASRDSELIKPCVEIIKTSLVGAPIVRIDKNQVRREKQKKAKYLENEKKPNNIVGVLVNNNNNNNNIQLKMNQMNQNNYIMNYKEDEESMITDNESKCSFVSFSNQNKHTKSNEIMVNNYNNNNKNEEEFEEEFSKLSSIETDCNMGTFRKLNRDTSIYLLSFLTVKEIVYLGSTSRGVECLCNDWIVWRRLFKTRYPRSALKPSGLNCCWKRAYMLEINCLSEDLLCFNSRITKNEGILGFPIWFTTNPKTGCLDYATSTFDILSYESYSKDMVRRTVWGEKFTNFLPIYIDEDHFGKSINYILSVSKEIVDKGINLKKNKVNENQYNNKHNKYNKYNNHNNNNKYINDMKNLWIPQSDCEKVLTFLTKMMNTQVVLLCDKGIAASEVALMGYCQLHRLLLAFVDKFPELRISIRKRLEIFAQKPECRVKEFTPSLGEFLALLSVSDTYGWNDLSMVYLKESFDRSVLWSCTKDPSLSKIIVGDMSRLDKYLETQKVSLRLTLYHAVFLRMLVQGGGSRSKLNSCIDRYDTFQGRPPLYIRREFQKAVKEILDFNTWPEFFRISDIPLPTKNQLLLALENSVRNSLKKGYHSENTVFENVMKSGVSQILLKGETYSTSPSLKKVQMLEKWKFDTLRFLDASCLIYDFNGNNIGIVDYTQRRWTGLSKSDSKITKIGSFVYGFDNRSPCVSHSGDMIDHENKMGTHTIDIDINKLPNNVSSLYFTVSAWTTSLKEISQPSAHLYDPNEDVELCRYKLEDTDTGLLTSIIMCKLYRENVSSRWKLLSIGKLGMGRAGSYDPILKSIKKLIAESNKDSNTKNNNK